MFWKIVFVVLIIALLGLFQDMRQDVRNEAIEKQKYIDEYRPIKEMSVDLLTKGEVSGGYLLIAGSVYGYIDTQRYITLLYGEEENGEVVYSSIVLPIERVKIVTINKEEAPHLKPINFNKETKCYGDYGNCKNMYVIHEVKLYLPYSWQILKGDKP